MSTPPLRLYEALRYAPAEGFFLLDRHLERLARSAEHFSFPFDRNLALAALEEGTAKLTQACKVRVELGADGDLLVETAELKPSQTVTATLSDEPVDSANEYLRHKTSRREVYDRARRRHGHVDDVLLWNERRELTELCSGNLVMELGGELLTPALQSGLLPGTYRAELLARGEIREALLSIDELARATRLEFINSVRKSCPLQLMSSP